MKDKINEDKFIDSRIHESTQNALIVKKKKKTTLNASTETEDLKFEYKKWEKLLLYYFYAFLIVIYFLFYLFWVMGICRSLIIGMDLFQFSEYQSFHTFRSWNWVRND